MTYLKRIQICRIPFRLFGLVLGINVSLQLLSEYQSGHSLFPLFSLYPLLYPFISLLCKLLLHYFETHDGSEMFLICADLNYGPEKINYTERFESFLKKKPQQCCWLRQVNTNILFLIIVIHILSFTFGFPQHSTATLIDAIFSCVSSIGDTTTLCIAFVAQCPVKIAALFFFFVVSFTSIAAHQYLIKDKKELLICLLVIIFLCLFTFFTCIKLLSVFVFQ